MVVLKMTDETDHMDIENIENIELELVLKAIYLKYGYDFKGYARASVKRRIKHRLSLSGLETISNMQSLVLHDRDFFNTLLNDMSVNVTQMFRDPSFYRALRDKVISVLGKKSFLKIWHVGCSTGEEVYSMAIFLKEAGLYDHALIHATDFDEGVLAAADKGVYPVEKIKEFTKNYKDAGGLESFADYYTARYDFALLDRSLKKNIHFSNHNIVTDGVFGEMNMIICRNVLIYFSRELQEKIFKLFYESLPKGGFLCLGARETIKLSEYSEFFTDIDSKEKIYKKV